MITLILLLGVAGAGLFLGSQGPEEPRLESAATSLEPSLLPVVDFVPKEQRVKPLDGADFQRDPVRHPLAGGPGRDVNQPLDSAALDPASIRLRRVRVREKETLQSISQRELGSSKRWREIADLNGVSDPRALRIGQELLLPEEKSAALLDTKLDGPAAAPPRSYQVQKGDTAGEIAAKFYGSSRYWPQLLQANGITDPKNLRSGQTLILPELGAAQ